MTAFDAIAAGYRMGVRLVHGMCADLTPEEFQHQPVPGANSAAWIVGHLALTVKRTAERLGATDVPEVSEEFTARFKATRQGAEIQKQLGKKEELLALLDQVAEKLIGVILKLKPDALEGPAPVQAPPFVTSASDMFVFGTLHISLHCGQLSTIRRSLGKPPLV